MVYSVAFMYVQAHQICSITCSAKLFNQGLTPGYYANDITPICHHLTPDTQTQPSSQVRIILLPPTQCHSMILSGYHSHSMYYYQKLAMTMSVLFRTI